MAAGGNPIERAAVQLGAGRFAEAKAILEATLRTAPRDVTALMLAGIVAAKMGDADAALAFMERAAKADPNNPQACANWGAALNKAGKVSAAIEAYRAAIVAGPAYVPAYVNLGIILTEEERFPEAIALLETAITLAPGTAEGHHSLGNALMLSGRLDEAIRSLERALALKPGFLNAMSNLGLAYLRASRYTDALRMLSTLYARAPEFKNALGQLLHVKHQLCDWEGEDVLIEALMRTISEERVTPPAFLLHFPIGPSDILRATRTYALKELTLKAHVAQRRPHTRNESPRLRIGYLSEDLREHALARLAVEVFELHDKNRFEVFAYSSGRNDGSSLRRRIEGSVDHFIDARMMGREELAGRIKGDDIAILIDLQGYTGQGRPGVLAMRPAALQVNWLGYPSTMGAPWMDYIIADPVLIPEGHEGHYAEKVIRLPGSYQPNDRQRHASEPRSRADYGLPEGAFVFCSFNQTVKITREVFLRWMRILEAVPGSVLWLMERSLEANANLRREAARAGIDPARLIFATRASQADHLARYRIADLALDTMPYGSHTTGSDALWLGCPLITCTQTNTFAARVAASLLHAAELPDLVTADLDAYEALAIALATDKERLGALKARLAQARPRCALFDSPRFVRDLERAYATIWHRSLSGLAPDHLTL
ncbi:MAG: tetratricopeptide repeat protein [Alphaproteobacteria bacterium]|nr:tetratricopeptide repeat protein [Alphaproteobacteria bacterium]